MWYVVTKKKSRNVKFSCDLENSFSEKYLIHISDKWKV